MKTRDHRSDHGGDLERAMARFGGATEEWIDLSTGINRQPWPLPDIPLSAWADLPRRARMEALCAAAGKAYGSAAPIVALAGAQAAIQLVPRLRAPGLARVLAPSYNEHAACLRAEGWRVEEVGAPEALAGADLAVIVSPNNPDGRQLSAAALRGVRESVGLLVLDESFAEAGEGPSLAAEAGPGLLVLRSFGKFYGLAGIRLGFALGDAADIARLVVLAGPWPVAGPAIEIGIAALEDRGWQAATARRLAGEALRLDGLAARAGWRLVGGTGLFRLYDTEDAEAAQARLGKARIWSRIFPYSGRWIRLGLPGSAGEWARLEAALG